MAEKIFDRFWKNHPSNQNPPNNEPCSSDGSPNFPNECCIRFGTTLVASGIKLTKYKGAFCWYGHGKTHPLRVEEMKLWLNSDAVTFVKKAEISRRTHDGHQKTYRDYQDMRGIIVFRNFWGENNQGDHIDLWNGTKVAHGALDYFERSEEIWYWKMA